MSSSQLTTTITGPMTPAMKANAKERNEVSENIQVIIIMNLFEILIEY